MGLVTVVVPGPFTARTGGSIYDRRIADGLRAGGWTVDVVELDAVAHPLAPPLGTSVDRFAAIPDGRLVLVDGLAFGTMPEIVEREARRLRFIPIVHMPLSATPGLTPGEMVWLRGLERRALVHARHIIVTGRSTIARLQSMDAFDATRVTTVHPGTDRPMTRLGKQRREGPLRLLCVANVTAGKGHDILLSSLADEGGNWTLTCAGSLDRDPDYVQALRRLARDARVHSRLEWTGELDATALSEEYSRADVFVLATRGETYGMAVADAIAHHLPVVSTSVGEIGSIVGEGGILVEPGSIDELRAAIRAVMNDAELRQTLSDGACRAAAKLPTWDQSVESVAAVLTKVAQA